MFNIGDKVKVVDTEQKKLSQACYDFLMSQPEFEVMDVIEKEGRQYLDIGFKRGDLPYYYPAARFEKRVVPTFENLKTFEEFDWTFGLGKKIDNEKEETEEREFDDDNDDIITNNEDDEFVSDLIEDIKNSPFKYNESDKIYEFMIDYNYGDDHIHISRGSNGWVLYINDVKMDVSKSLIDKLRYIIYNKSKEDRIKRFKDKEDVNREKVNLLKNRISKRPSVEYEEDTRTWDNYNTKKFEEFDWKFGFGKKKISPEQLELREKRKKENEFKRNEEEYKKSEDDKLFQSIMNAIHSEFDPNKIKWDTLEESADGEYEDTFGYIYSIEDDELGISEDGFVMINNEDMNVSEELAMNAFNFFDTEYKKNKAGAKATNKEQLKRKYIKSWHDGAPDFI